MTNDPEPMNIWTLLALLAISLIAVWMITGCASPGLQPVENLHRPVPVSLTEPSPEPRPLPDGEMGTLYTEYLRLLGDYRVCRARHEGLSEWARSLTDED